MVNKHYWIILLKQNLYLSSIIIRKFKDLPFVIWVEVVVFLVVVVVSVVVVDVLSVAVDP